MVRIAHCCLTGTTFKQVHFLLNFHSIMGFQAKVGLDHDRNTKYGARPPTPYPAESFVRNFFFADISKVLTRPADSRYASQSSQQPRECAVACLRFGGFFSSNDAR